MVEGRRPAGLQPLPAQLARGTAGDDAQGTFVLHI